MNISALRQRSNRRGLQQLVLHLGLLAGIATGIQAAADSSRFYPLFYPLLICYGFLLVFLFAPLHESIHFTACKSRRLNTVIAFFTGLVLLLPPRYFRVFHLAHHRHTQDPLRDPELLSAKPVTPVNYLLYLSGLPYWLERITSLFKHAAGIVDGAGDEAFIPHAKYKSIIREARLFLAVYLMIALLSLAYQSTIALQYWIIPALLGQPFLRAFLYAEHSGCSFTSDSFENTRTTISNRMFRQLCWNMNYHTEHHAYASLPFFALPAAHVLLQHRIRQQASSYLDVHRNAVRGLIRQQPEPRS